MLSDRDVDTELIELAVRDGYVHTNIANPVSGEMAPGVKDTYYGQKVSGLIPLDSFVSILRREPVFAPFSRAPHYSVSSLAEAEHILATPRHAQFRDRMSFRGQTTQFMLRRSIPNPAAADNTGAEPMILPSLWRRYVGKDPSDREVDFGRSRLVTPLLAEPLVFHDIPDWGLHLEEHGISPADYYEAFPDEKCREIWRRYNAHFIEGPFSSEIPLLEQHYGVPTIGLDVTFDLATAFFFAAHKFEANSGQLSTYRPINVDHVGSVIYCFVFESPSLRRTSEQVKATNVFSHMPPLRPIRQQCALSAFHIDEIGAAARDLDAVIHLEPGFDFARLPKMKYLFPGRDEDPFYAALLKEKRLMNRVWDLIVEYE